MTSVAPAAGKSTLGTYQQPSSVATPATSRSEPRRIASIDIIRGAVMVLMAIDHVRVFSGLPAGGPTPGIFFTRWVTHFCAPAFIFLAGTAAFLHGTRLGDRGALARYLAIRGAWLILLELTFLRFAWTFNFDYASYMLAGVIWVIGWCMILLAGLIYLPLPAIGAFGIAIIAGHNVMDPFVPQLTQSLRGASLAWFWQLLYFGGPIRLGGEDGTNLAVLYSIVPWVGVIAAGYAFGPVMRFAPERRRRVCLTLGGAAIAAFIVLRAFNLYGDPRPWNGPPSGARGAQGGQGARWQRPQGAPAPTARGTQPTQAAPPQAQGGRPGASPNAPRQRMPGFLAFLNTAKYPASLLFLLMTLGPTIALIPLLERARGPVAKVLSVFGRVPFFYYVLHIPLIHLIFVLLSLARFGEVVPWMTANHPLFVPPPPEGYTYGLTALYAITIVAVTLLYFPCRWFADLKSRRRDRWLSFL